MRPRRAPGRRARHGGSRRVDRDAGLGRRVDGGRADLEGAPGRDAAAGRARDGPDRQDGDRPPVVPEPVADAGRCTPVVSCWPGTTATSCSGRRRATRCATPTATAPSCPRDQWVPTRTDTIFDLASVSKLFTSIALVQQVEAGTDRPGPHRRVVHPGVRRQRQAGRDRAAAAHPHLGVPCLAAAVEQLPDARGADPGACTTPSWPTRRAPRTSTPTST